MLEDARVLETQVEHQGATYKASYFVVDDIVHARIAGRILLSPLAGRDPADVVKSLLLGHLVVKGRRSRNTRAWLNPDLGPLAKQNP